MVVQGPSRASRASPRAGPSRCPLHPPPCLAPPFVLPQVIQKRKHLNKPRRRRRVRDEMRVLASLRHPNIIPLLAVYETPTDLLLLMERAQVS